MPVAIELCQNTITVAIELCKSTMPVAIELCKNTIPVAIGGGGGGGGNAILGYFRPYLSRAIFGFLRCTWPKIALKLKQVNICSSN